MGGISIQEAMMHENFNTNRIAFILSFAVPYAEPRNFLLFKLNYFSFPAFYFDKRFLNFWHEMDNKSFTVPTISINGGLKDEFIDEDWTKSHFLVSHSSTNALDHVWLDMDHKCILWCNQLVR
jgi:GPI inositol-deacylase